MLCKVACSEPWPVQRGRRPAWPGATQERTAGQQAHVSALSMAQSLLCERSLQAPCQHKLRMPASMPADQRELRGSTASDDQACMAAHLPLSRSKPGCQAGAAQVHNAVPLVHVQHACLDFCADLCCNALRLQHPMSSSHVRLNAEVVHMWRAWCLLMRIASLAAAAAQPDDQVQPHC